MSGFQIDIPGQGPVLFDTEDQARDYLKRHPAEPAPEVPSNFAVRAPGLAQPSQKILQGAQQFQGMDKKQLKATGDAMALAEKAAGRDLPPEIVQKMAGYGYTFDLLKQVAQLKNEGFTEKKKKSVVRAPVDTGPIAKYIPNSVSSWYNQAVNGMSPYDASARGRLEQSVTALVNPIRKETTGAQAAVQEIENWIAPMVPQVKDDDDVFNGKLIDAATRMLQKQREEINAHRQAGYNVPDEYDLEHRMPELLGVVPKKYQVSAPKPQGGQ